MDFNFSEDSLALQQQLRGFYTDNIIPRWREWQASIRRDDVPEPDFVPGLRALAKSQGLWNLALPELAEEDPGTRLSNLDYAPLAEYMGRFHGSALVFNCQPPDVPNMIALQHDANPEQRRRWLEPLLQGDMRSAFAMTEYDVASSDATNIRTSMRRDGDHYVIDGHKWFITGAAHPDCAFFIVMAQTDPDAPRARQHSTIIVPADAESVNGSLSGSLTVPVLAAFAPSVTTTVSRSAATSGGRFPVAPSTFTTNETEVSPKSSSVNVSVALKVPPLVYE